MKEIPCKDCLILEACKAKDNIICELLFDYMQDGIGTLNSKKVWKKVNSFFERYDDQITVSKNGGMGMYAVGPENVVAAIERGERENDTL